jgi:hypothetical protein
MAWIDNNGEIRPQSWEEYCEMKERVPAWALPLQKVYQPLHMKHPNRHGDQEGVPRMRQRLFRADPHCFWCGTLTRLGQVNGPIQATIDHLYSRLHPERVDRYREQKGVLHVLACAACNGERGVCEQQRRPFTPKLKARLEFARLADATLANAHEGKMSSPPTKTSVALVTARRLCTLKEAIEFARENPAR